MTHDTRTHLLRLLDALCDDHASSDEIAQIERIVLFDTEARELYVDYLSLHGTLAWDAGLGTSITDRTDVARKVDDTVGTRSRSGRWSTHRWSLAIAGTVAASILALLLVVFRPAPTETPIVVSDGPSPIVEPEPDHRDAPAVEDRTAPRLPHVPIQIATQTNPSHPGIAPVGPDDGVLLEKRTAVATDTPSVVRNIDARLASSWTAADVRPSARADEAEWVRRVFLDVAGRIPDVEAVERFLADGRSDRRERLLEDLLTSSDYPRHFATIWTNLLVGRSSDKPVDRVSLSRFLRRQFHENRPWSDTVGELIAAEGTEQENGASAFLLAHLNSEAVPATAITARLFLCTQVHCTQCHKHPTNGASQDEFWGFNSFFQQTAVVERDAIHPVTKERRKERALVNEEAGGPTFYEDLRGVVRVAYPKLAGREVDSGPGVNRRRELAGLLVTGDRPQLARAMVNRMWAHFFGHGFTTPVDDMGPHTPVSHPELLDDLTEAFVAGGYDVRQLIRWICTSEAYQLTSGFGAGNRTDEPAEGHPPQFSRMYVKPLSAEQMFDSLLVATNAHRSVSWNEVESRRQAWLDQFYEAVDNEENGEASTFDGSFAQTLMMMNGDLIRQAVSGQPGTSLYDVLNGPGNESEKVRRLCLTALSRQPTPKELGRLVDLVRKYRKDQRQPVEVALNEGLSDVLWAYLNSSEFAVNH